MAFVKEIRMELWDSDQSINHTLLKIADDGIGIHTEKVVSDVSILMDDTRYNYTFIHNNKLDPDTKTKLQNLNIMMAMAYALGFSDTADFMSNHYRTLLKGGVSSGSHVQTGG